MGLAVLLTPISSQRKGMSESTIGERVKAPPATTSFETAREGKKSPASQDVFALPEYGADVLLVRGYYL